MPNQNSKLKRTQKLEWISRDAVFVALEMEMVLEHYDIKTGRSESYRVHCPFHEDDRPSCSVNTKAKVFNCFACGEQGNMLDFIGVMEGLDPKKSFRMVLEKAIDILGYNPTPKRVRGKETSSHGEEVDDEGQEPQDATRLENSSKVKQKRKTKADYQRKKKRKSKSKRTSSDESLGLEPNRVLEAPAFPLKLDVKHPWLEERLEAIGLTFKDAKRLGIGYETRSSALMAGRICFPIHNVKGELVAYAGRWASDEVDEHNKFVNEKGREQERYKLPKDFKKQLELYNLSAVVRKFPSNDHLVIVEGFWSVLRLSSLNIPTVALMGRTMSKAQISLLKEYGISHLVLMLDGDEKGRSASEELLPVLAKEFFVKDYYLEDGIKPDTVDEASLKDLSNSLDNSITQNPRAEPDQSNPEPSNSIQPFGSIGYSYVMQANR